MSETSSIEPQWTRRLRLAVQTVVVVLGAVLVAALPFSDLLAWAGSSQGLGQSGFWAWLVALWLAASPFVLALAAGESWRRGHRARDLVIIAWVLIALAAIARWESASWAELVVRSVALAITLVMVRPMDPPGDAAAGEGGDEG
ncbi:hypothetical protein [Streptosporangium roseum]|uniref:hypothetical protein n=1 Tax=Streptosporangium roseum TaxID=2001 RepID=UPI003326375B